MKLNPFSLLTVLSRAFSFPRRATMATCWVASSIGLALTPSVRAAPDLYIKDTPADTGVEPNPDSGPMWVSEDIWVRQNAIAGYQPYPFAADPAWLTALSPLHENPEYRDPKYSRPNYVYVRVRNRGSTASSGTERLRVYWAKASTGLGWPNQWVDYLAANCGPTKLYGIEITKPRRNAADTSVPIAELNEYRDAIIAVGTMAGFQFPDAVSYWHKQQSVHAHVVANASAGFAAHTSDGFLPWHREYINRYEVLLREAYPRVTLFYWDWTTDPSTAPRIPALMGSFGGAIGAPFNVLAPPTVSRFLGTSLTAMTPTATSDATIVGQATFGGHRFQNETPAHNRSHNYVGGTGGTLTSPSTAARDPFFFLLHGNADRLWAMWQRGNPNRYDPASAFSGSASPMNIPMSPWNGLRTNATAAGAGNMPHGISPWTTTGGYIVMKPANDPSVVFPPIYDTAPLTIPVLQPGESVVIGVPWYPPNPMDFSCFGADQGHVCLLARIETSLTAPFGMATAEGADVNANTRNNNNVAWKNVTVQDMWPGQLLIASTWLRNLSLRETVPTRLVLRRPAGLPVPGNAGSLFLDLRAELYARWLQGGARGQGFERVPNSTRLQLFGAEATVDNIPLLPDEVQPVEVLFRLNQNYPPPEGRVLAVDLEQLGAPRKLDQLIGGQRIEFDFNKLSLIAPGAKWRYWTRPFRGEEWRGPEYDDSRWPCGNAPLGYGLGDERTVIDDGRDGGRRITTYFRHTFNLTHNDIALYHDLQLRLRADDGAAVYLNGVELIRTRLPLEGDIISPDARATESVKGLAQDVFESVRDEIGLRILREGVNVVAVEVHQDALDSPDLAFDLELCANPPLREGGEAPAVKWLSPLEGSLHLVREAIGLSVEAIDPERRDVTVEYVADGISLARLRQPPYQFVWSNAPAGSHQIIARASDGILTGEAYMSIQVVSNLPPLVRLTEPAHETSVLPGTAVRVGAVATDIGGSIQRVEFYRKAHEPTFNEPEELIGTVNSAPYSVVVTNLPSGHYTLTAVATDNQGAMTRSAPVVFDVMEVRPELVLQRRQNRLELSWTHGALLQEAASPLGPWNDLPNATNPMTLAPVEKTKFYRAVVK